LAGLKVRVDEVEELDELVAGGLVGFFADLAFGFLGSSTELNDESDLGFGFLGLVFFMRVAFGFLEPGDNLGGEVLGGSFFFRWGEGFLFFLGDFFLFCASKVIGMSSEAASVADGEGWRCVKGGGVVYPAANGALSTKSGNRGPASPTAGG
jgi:hypothetical protein